MALRFFQNSSDKYVTWIEWSWCGHKKEILCHNLETSASINHINRLIKYYNITWRHNWTMRWVCLKGTPNTGTAKGSKLFPGNVKYLERIRKYWSFSFKCEKIVDHFIGLFNKYGWECLAFRVETANRSKIIFLQVVHISIEKMKMQTWGYFGTQGIVNQNTSAPSHLAAQNIGTIDNNFKTQKFFFNRVCSDIISRLIEVSITKKSLRKIWLLCSDCEWADIKISSRNDENQPHKQDWCF